MQDVLYQAVPCDDLIVTGGKIIHFYSDKQQIKK